MNKTQITYGNFSADPKTLDNIQLDEIFKEMKKEFIQGTVVNIKSDDNPRKTEAIYFQIHFSDDKKNISLYKPWPIVIINSKFEIIAKKDFEKLDESMKVILNMALDHVLEKTTV